MKLLLNGVFVRCLLSNICEACWFTIIADEMCDITSHEQLAQLCYLLGWQHMLFMKILLH